MLVMWPAPHQKDYYRNHDLWATLEFSAKSEAVFSKPFHATSRNTGERVCAVQTIVVSSSPSFVTQNSSIANLGGKVH